MRILVTGASGFIGKHFSQEVTHKKHEVITLSRQLDANLIWKFGDVLPSNSLLQGVDYAVHLAHDFDGEKGANRTVAGTMNVIKKLRALGVKRQVFFSSLSARPNSASLYGRTKYEIEQRLVDAEDVVIIRPGLVLGNGGLYGRIQNWVRKWPIVPLPDGGVGKIHVIHIGDLCQQALSILVSVSKEREFNLFEPLSKRLSDLVKYEARTAKKKIVIIPVPSSYILFLLQLTEKTGLQLPITADNLMGFLANQSSFDQSTLD